MVSLGQRLEALRTERGLSRPALSAQLGWGKGTVEKFETGRQTPAKEQQEQLAAFFGVSLFYLRGESGDRTRQDSWMDLAGGVPEQPPPAPPAAPPQPPAGGQGATVMDALLSGKQVRDLLRGVVLDTLRSPEGQELIAKVVRRELERRGK